MSIQQEWQLLRAEANEDGSPIDLTTGGDYANMPAAAKDLGYMIAELVKSPLHLAIIACAGAAADKTFTLRIFGWATQNGPAQVLCLITCTTGSQAVVKYPHSKAAATNKFWADTASVIERWANGVTVGDGDGSDGVAEVRIPYLRGLRYLFAQVEDADGVTGDEAGNVSVYYRLYAV